MSCRTGAVLVMVLATILSHAGHAVAQLDEEPQLTPVDKQQIEAALKVTREAAGKYKFGDARDEAASLKTEPVLRWSNPATGEVHGNVFLWTINSRPAVVGSLYQWFSPHTHMSHEFHSLHEQKVTGRYEDKEVWTTSGAGVEFQAVGDAPPPTASAPQRLLQMKKLSKRFSAHKEERDGNRSELRLLTQPIYRYAADKQGVVDGALFAFVQGTDPEVLLLLEARRQEDATSWQFAAARMNGVGFELRFDDREVWAKEVLPWKDIRSHRETYTTFMFNK